VIERVRSISEHFALPYTHDFNQTRNIHCSPLEAFIFGPHNIRYHLTHHLHPSVPQYNLPALHKALMQDPEYAAHAHENDAYFYGGKKSVFQELIKNQSLK
jgi:fatty acid desaturase